MYYQRLFSIPNMGTLGRLDDLSRMRRQMDRIMDSMLDRSDLATGAGVFPALNLTEDEGFFYVRAELPGVKANDLNIQVTGKGLSISGERKLAVEDTAAKYHRREREGGRFSRALTLPREIDAERVEARLQDGILTLKIPKAESAKPRRITIAG